MNIVEVYCEYDLGLKEERSCLLCVNVGILIGSKETLGMFNVRIGSIGALKLMCLLRFWD